ncbi:hypothetical protein BV210_00480 [Halorientalis sp. IM1011]|uniref:hypothetical protein n=1 Tax=Halorientalis sp. IM1011 TaxID=1932360 RepID=UPI00097CCBF1|nr:hypothetical protein [Halorientalis sp. IM1011]AQL41278.1 hypothetical protein BV210_00480 [Halorientalis sp. IM1011]
MTDDFSDDTAAFLSMAREFPIRTCLFTVGLPAFALLQIINGLFNDGMVPYVALLAVLAVALSVILTRYHVAMYRRQAVTDSLSWDD